MEPTESNLGRKFQQMRRHLNERALRLWAAVEAESLGHGGVAAVARATGLSRTTIYAGLAELKQDEPSCLAVGRTRRVGGGRKRLTEKDPGLLVRVHDFVDPALGKAAPYGVYDLAANQGWVSVGIDHDTAEFAVESIRRWWQQMGQPLYPQATRLLITADGGGSNGYRVRLWKVALQHFANQTQLTIQVCHLPPGTSKWNKIEHRMFCHITQNWRGKPLESLAVIIQLIGHTTTATGLKIRTEIDASSYPKGQKISDEEMQQVRLFPDPFHGEWNYSISPQSSP